MNGIINQSRRYFEQTNSAIFETKTLDPKNATHVTSSFPTEAHTDAFGGTASVRRELLKMLWDAGIARDLSSSGRAGDHERNNVENRSNSREARSASGPSLVSLSRGHLLASRSSCLSRLV